MLFKINDTMGLPGVGDLVRSSEGYVYQVNYIDDPITDTCMIADLSLVDLIGQGVRAWVTATIENIEVSEGICVGRCRDCAPADWPEQQREDHRCAASDEDGAYGTIRYSVPIWNEAGTKVLRRYWMRSWPKCTVCGNGYCTFCGVRECKGT